MLTGTTLQFLCKS